MKKETEVGKERSLMEIHGIEPFFYENVFRLHDGLPEDFFKPAEIQYDPEEMMVRERISKKTMEEGLIRTYPTMATLEYACNTMTGKGYPMRKEHFLLRNPNDDSTIYGMIAYVIPFDILSKEFDEAIRKCFSICGYECSTFNRLDNFGKKCIVYQFEPKFQTNVSNISLRRYIFHVTTENAAKKILKKGFVPCNKNSKGFGYGGRCHFFTIYDRGLFARQMNDSGKCNRTGKYDFDENFVILTIDRSVIKNVRFFTDPAYMAKIAVYTYENIPPKAIVNVENL